MTGQDKTGWTGEEIIFVKDINDFCRDRLDPKEKFLRKNWQEYLLNDRGEHVLCVYETSIDSQRIEPKRDLGKSDCTFN